MPLWCRPLEGARHASGPFAGLQPVTIVTGASEGIGRAISDRFAAAGHALLLIGRRESELEAAGAEIWRRHGVEVRCLALDITEPTATGAIDTALAEMAGYAHILVNSAGLGASGAFADEQGARLASVIDLNIKALTLLMHHVLPGMRQRGCGGIVNLASLGGFAPGPWQAAYYASKAYVLSLSEAVAVEVAGDGVRVTAVAPGPVETLFHSRMGAESAFYRWLLPTQQPDAVAAWTYWAFRFGLRVIVPGLLNCILALTLRVVPHRISVEIIGWLLRPRKRETTDA